MDPYGFEDGSVPFPIWDPGTHGSRRCRPIPDQPQAFTKLTGSPETICKRQNWIISPTWRGWTLKSVKYLKPPPTNVASRL